jgi:hypothetical protein
MIHRTKSRTSAKTKKSFTLSPEAVAFLEQVRKKRHADSVSAVLEEILQAARRAHQRASLEQSVANYYSGLTGKDRTEQTEWGEFALSEFLANKED